MGMVYSTQVEICGPQLIEKFYFTYLKIQKFYVKSFRSFSQNNRVKCVYSF